MVTDSDEHDEEGHIIEDAETRIEMVKKRLLKKLPIIREEIDRPVFYGDSRPEIVLVGWGSTYGVLKETVDVLVKNKKAAMLHFSEIYPLPSPDALAQYLTFLNNAKFAVCIENNATGQFAHLVRAETGYEFMYRINRYDGRPFTLDSLLGELDGYIKGI